MGYFLHQLFIKRYGENGLKLSETRMLKNNGIYRLVKCNRLMIVDYYRHKNTIDYQLK